MKGRRIKQFSQRDRVRFDALKDGDEFVWKGNRHIANKRILIVGIAPFTRVIVSRQSGIANRALRDRTRRLED